MLLSGCASDGLERSNDNLPTTPVSSKPSHWPSNSVAAFNQGVSALGNDNEAARISFAEAIELSPQMEAAYYNLAKLDLDQKNFEAVDSFLPQAQKNNVASARLWNLFATSKRHQNDFDAAEKFYLQAIQLDSGYTPALLNIAILNDVYLGKIAEAQKYYLLYQQQLEQQGKQDNRLKNWLTDINRRLAPKTGG